MESPVTHKEKMTIPKAAGMSESEEKQQLPGHAERLISLAEKTFGRRDLANRWLNQPHPLSWGRCPITLVSGTTEQRKIFELLLEIDKNILAADPEPESSAHSNEIPAGGFKIGSELARLGTEVGGIDIEFSRIHPPTDPSEYLRAFFQHLNKLKPIQSWDRARSHAITYEKDSIFVLISVGDFRRKVTLKDLDRDPAAAADRVMQAWKKVKNNDDITEFE